MKHILKFEEVNEAKRIDKPENVGLISDLLTHLDKGFAIEVEEKNFDDFFDIIEKYGTLKQGGIDYHRIDIGDAPEKMYFVLIGDRVFHTNNPKFGGEDLRVFRPEFPLNEGKLQRSLAKSAVSVAVVIKKFSKLFNKVERMRLFKNIKSVNKMIDLLTFMKDSQSWLTDDQLSMDDKKTLADNLGIDKKYPTEWDIFEARYELEFKRKLKDDLNDITEALSGKFKGQDPKSLVYFKDIKEMAETLKELI